MVVEVCTRSSMTGVVAAGVLVVAGVVVAGGWAFAGGAVGLATGLDVWACAQTQKKRTKASRRMKVFKARFMIDRLMFV